MRRRKHGCSLAIATTLACSLPTASLAEIRIEGNLRDLRVSTNGDALSDVLSAFIKRLPVTYRTAVPLNKEINGSYSGSFSQVISRLLVGYSYVIKNDQKLTEIIVTDEKSMAPVSPEAPVARGPSSRWR